MTVEQDLERFSKRLDEVIREQGYTPLEVEEKLGWRRGHISQRSSRHKSLHFAEVLRILDLIKVEPADFWGSVFGFGEDHEKACRSEDLPTETAGEDET